MTISALTVAAIGAERRSDERAPSHLPEPSETAHRRGARDSPPDPDQPADPKEDS